MLLKPTLSLLCALGLIHQPSFASSTTIHDARKAPLEKREDSFNATRFSLIYSLPLVSYAIYAAPYIAANGSAGINTPHPQRHLATSNNKQLVKPNVDVLYTPTVYDLSENDLIVHVPEFLPNQYWSFSFHDPYGDNYHVLGVANHTESGDYVLKLRGTNSEALEGLTTKPRGVIESTTAYGIILVRYLVTAGNQTDIEEVDAIQNNIHITEIPRSCGPKIPTLYSIIKEYINPLITLDEPERQLKMLAAFAENNLPLLPSARKKVAQRLADASIAHGTYTKPENLNLTAADLSALITCHNEADSNSSYKNVGNGWGLDKHIGDYGEAYVNRAVIGKSGYLAMVPEYQIYPTYLPTVFSTASLPAGKSYLLTFFGKPPITSVGYWSVTMYNAEFYLVANKLNRYSLGDRSNMTYPDGKPVYGLGAGKNGDFQMLLQAANAAPPANWTSNWLPAPIGGGDLTFNCKFCFLRNLNSVAYLKIVRFGVPEASLTDGRYKYPKVETIDAITA